MGMTAFRLRERLARGEISPKAPPVPSHVLLEQFREERVQWQKEASMLRSRIAELEAQLSDLTAPPTRPAAASGAPRAPRASARRSKKD